MNDTSKYGGVASIASLWTVTLPSVFLLAGRPSEPLTKETFPELTDTSIFGSSIGFFLLSDLSKKRCRAAVSLLLCNFDAIRPLRKACKLSSFCQEVGYVAS